MRKCILSLKDLEYKIVENKVKIGDILEAEEVFLTNAIQGVRWVSHIKEQQFTEKKVAKLLTSKINQLV
jgi:branched-chain amino acid aminotransferase